MGNATAQIIKNVDGTYRAVCCITSMVLFTRATSLSEAILKVKEYNYEFYRL